MNDEIVETILCLCHAALGALVMAFAYGYCHVLQLSIVDTCVIVLAGLALGVFMPMVALKVVSSAVATIYVCFAEHPKEFEVCVLCALCPRYLSFSMNLHHGIDDAVCALV